MVQKKSKGAKAEPKRRGRPRAYDPATAIARAAETFWKAGYAGTSLDDLSAATGMNRPSLYAAFGDKRDLYLKALEIYLTDGPRGCYSIGTAATVAAVDDNVRAFLADSMRTTDGFLRHQIEKAKARGEIAADRSEERRVGKECR